MITFTQMKQMAAEICGIDINAPQMDKIAADINIGIKRFQNASRRYWTRREKKTDIVSTQQYYQFPEDMLRVSEVKVLISDKEYPVKQIHSEDQWNKINLVQSFASNIPIYYFIRGNDEIGLYPIPSQNITNGLRVSYEPRMPDLSIEDMTFKVNLIRGDYIVERNAEDNTTGFSEKYLNNCYIKPLSEGNDGRWYKITGYQDASKLEMENYWQGLSETNASAIIGQSPVFPEEYHIAPIYYACAQYFLIRKDDDSASTFISLFDKTFNEYKQVYGLKTTGGVINPNHTKIPNIFNLPPNSLIG